MKSMSTALGASGSQLSGAQKLCALSSEQRRQWIAVISDDEAEAILHAWEFWARTNQLEPAGDWVNWLVMAGRGFGKTRIGAEQVRKWGKAEARARQSWKFAAKTKRRFTRSRSGGWSGAMARSRSCSRLRNRNGFAVRSI